MLPAAAAPAAVLSAAAVGCSCPPLEEDQGIRRPNSALSFSFPKKKKNLRFSHPYRRGRQPPAAERARASALASAVLVIYGPFLTDKVVQVQLSSFRFVDLQNESAVV